MTRTTHDKNFKSGTINSGHKQQPRIMNTNGGRRKRNQEQRQEREISERLKRLADQMKAKTGKELSGPKIASYQRAIVSKRRYR